MNLKYNYTVSDLIDRLCVVSLKEIHAPNPEMKRGFYDEIQDICADIDSAGLPAQIIRATIVLAMGHVVVWDNEDAARTEADQNPAMLVKTHKLNMNRAHSRARISQLLNQRIDPKLNYLSGLWEIKW